MDQIGIEMTIPKKKKGRAAKEPFLKHEAEPVRMWTDRTIIPCGICGTEIHDYEAKVACLLPADGKPRAEFVCDDCYKQWREGKLDG
jgi:hypothetical protein